MRLLKWLGQLVRPIKCANFDCQYEWDGECRHDGPDLGLYEEIAPASLYCYRFKQVEGG